MRPGQQTHNMLYFLRVDGKLCLREIKKTTTPGKRIIKTLVVIDKAPLQVDTATVLCMAEQFNTFDK